MNPANIGRATIVAAVLVLAAGPLLKFGIMPWAPALGMFAIGAILAGIGGLYCLWQLLRRRGGTITVLAAAAGLAAAAIPGAILLEASDKPPINDITTDVGNPPAYVGITAAMRGEGAAPLSYDPSFAPQQARAYPDVRPLDLPVTPDKAFAIAMAATQGWEVVASDPATGRIEATDTVAWWGFKDDIVVRLTATPTGTRVDLRSKSRVGKGDLAVNANRITAYLDRVAAEMRKTGV
ncbi:DUF1499 domain-containing protein [Sandarakinorhabdus sp.]|uniref:DUF1499 domain-containing protein n=1 Tax=Sandarakinorhabdus sp. TaxID=1916663 RepID=UPI00286D89A7|nr:DUF1499 domain-containing protein [Sandarakinorhabdus sp.]